MRSRKDNSEDDKTSLALPFVSMAEEAVTVVDDIELQADNNDGKHALEKPMTDEISSYSSAENMKLRERKDHDTARKETQAPAENIALLLKTLTLEQINTLIFQSEVAAAKQRTSPQKTSNGIKKRKKDKKIEGQAPGSKKNLMSKTNRKSEWYVGSQSAAARTRRTGARPSLSKK